VINLDDPRGESLVRISSRPITYAISRPADVTPGPLSLTWQGLVFEARTPRGPVQVRSRLVGRPNVSNILAAVSTAIGLVFRSPRLKRAWPSLKVCPDGFRWCRTRATTSRCVDYAHTDDALKNLLETARPLAQAVSLRSSVAAAIAIGPSAR
jgi:UDP-N-acetylmuramoyl-L-alanyl-D-glutamate--2,6-diaminopimelate ligase